MIAITSEPSGTSLNFLNFDLFDWIVKGPRHMMSIQV